jgi:MipA family protein
VIKNLFSIFMFFLTLVFVIPGPAYCNQYPLWEVGLGGVFLYMPDYRGADEYRGYAFPFPYVIYRGDRFKIDRDGIRSLLFQTDRLKLDFSLNGTVPVDSTKNKARQGMPNLDPTFEIGPSLQVLLDEGRETGYKVYLNFPVRVVFSTDFIRVFHQGWTFSPGLNIDVFERGGRRRWDLGMGIGPVFGDQAFHDYFYRVDRSYATADRPAYSPQGGYGGLQLSTYLSRAFNKFRVTLFARANYLDGAVFSDSPLVKNNFSILAGISIAYFFWESQTRVEANR